MSEYNLFFYIQVFIAYGIFETCHSRLVCKVVLRGKSVAWGYKPGKILRSFKSFASSYPHIIWKIRCIWSSINSCFTWLWWRSSCFACASCSMILILLAISLMTSTRTALVTSSSKIGSNFFPGNAYKLKGKLFILFYGSLNRYLLCLFDVFLSKCNLTLNLVDALPLFIHNSS